jgi:hypothetical protein
VHMLSWPGYWWLRSSWCSCVAGAGIDAAIHVDLPRLHVSAGITQRNVTKKRDREVEEKRWRRHPGKVLASGICGSVALQCSLNQAPAKAIVY